MIPFSIDNHGFLLGNALNELLASTVDKPFDIATAYFAISGYREVKDCLHEVGAFRLLIGSDPQTGADIGLKPNDRKALQARLKGDLEAEAFTPETLKLVEDLIAFLRAERVQVRLYDKGFLHAKCYLFHQDRVTEANRDDRLRPYAAIVGSSNFTAGGLVHNQELNLVHRVFTHDDEPTDNEAAHSVEYLSEGIDERETMLDPSGIEVPPPARRLIKSEVGARAITDLTRWFERQWADSLDFKDDLVELLDTSKFGATEYTPYQIYMKALYEYFKDELVDGEQELGRSAVNLAEFQDDAVKKARRILSRYDGVLIADSVGLGKTWIGKRPRGLCLSSSPEGVGYLLSFAAWHVGAGAKLGDYRGSGCRHGKHGTRGVRSLAVQRCRCHPDRRKPQLPQFQFEPIRSHRAAHSAESWSRSGW